MQSTLDATAPFINALTLSMFDLSTHRAVGICSPPYERHVTENFNLIAFERFTFTSSIPVKAQARF